MKRITVIFLTFFILLSIINAVDDRGWGGKPSWVSGTASGAENADMTISESEELAGGLRVVGIDPAGGILWIYVREKLQEPIAGTRTGMALHLMDSQDFLLDLAQCEDKYMPVVGNTLIVYYGKVHKDVNGNNVGYYGATTLIVDYVSEDPLNPLYTNDIYMYQIPVPHASFSDKYNIITWDEPQIQPVGNENGVPIVGYNLYYIPELGKPAVKLNITPLSFETRAFQDNARTGAYYLTLVMQNGVELGTYSKGPDGYYGYKGVDDNGNGSIDEPEELGYGDDIYAPIYSKMSNFIGEAVAPKEPASLVAINSDKKAYLSWAYDGINIDYFNVYYSDDGGKSYQFLDKSYRSIYCDTKAVSGYYYRVTAVSGHGLESGPSNAVTVKPFNGTLAEGYLGSEAILYPTWSQAPVSAYGGLMCVSYFKYDSVQQVGNLFVSDLKNNIYPMIDDGLRVYWGSMISWGDYDKSIYFCALDSNSHSQIFVIPAEPAARNKYNQVSLGWGNWVDPDWTDDYNQYQGRERIACAIDGDIWLFDPRDVRNTFVTLTEFSQPYDNPKAVYKLYQPKWSPDNNEIAFIIRHPEYATNPALSDIFIINNVQEMIYKLISGSATPIKSLTDPRLEKVTYSYGDVSYLNKWCPSWSNDKTMLSYSIDITQKFENYGFAQSFGQALEMLSATNFDVWIYERGIGTWPAGYPSISTAKNEGFVEWSPAGGDRFAVSTADFSGRASQLEQFVDPSIKGFSGSKMVKTTESGMYLTISDRDMTSITVLKDDISPFTDIMIFPNEKPLLNVPFGLKDMGSQRYYYLNGLDELPFNVRVKIHYTRFQKKGFAENRILPYRYNEATMRWEPLANYTVISDEDGNPGNDLEDGGFIEMETNKLGLIAIMCPDDDDDDDDDDAVKENVDNIKIGPNPFRGDGVIVLENVPQETIINIYGLSGELLASSRNTMSLKWNADHWEWVAKNDDFKDIASGIYIISFNYNGQIRSKKVAIIK